MPKDKKICKIVDDKKVCKPRLAWEGKAKTKVTPRKETIKSKKRGIKEKQVMTPRKTTYKTKISRKEYKRRYK